MPITTAQGGLSLGRDCTLVLIGGALGRIDMPNVTDFNSMQETAPVTSDRLDGVQIYGDIPKGWHGSFGADRGNAALDDFFSALEAAWYGTGVLITGTLYQYLNEPDGSKRTYQFDSCSLKYDDAGNWRGDSKVPQKLSFRANRRRSV